MPTQQPLRAPLQNLLTWRAQESRLGLKCFEQQFQLVSPCPRRFPPFSF